MSRTLPALILALALCGCASTHCNKGQTCLDQRQYSQAIQHFTKAIAINPDDPSAYVNRGRAFRGRGEHDRAIQDYGKAIELDPKDDTPYLLRAGAYSDRGDYDLGVLEYNKVLTPYCYCIRYTCVSNIWTYSRTLFCIASIFS